MAETPNKPTSMFVGDRDVKDRFDQLKRELEADRGCDLKNADVLEVLLDEYRSE